MTIKNSLKRFLADESGASMAEYALLLGVVVVAMVAALTAFREDLTAAFSNAGTAMSTTP